MIINHATHDRSFAMDIVRPRLGTSEVMNTIEYGNYRETIRSLNIGQGKRREDIGGCNDRIRELKEEYTIADIQRVQLQTPDVQFQAYIENRLDTLDRMMHMPDV